MAVRVLTEAYQIEFPLTYAEGLDLVLEELEKAMGEMDKEVGGWEEEGMDQAVLGLVGWGLEVLGLAMLQHACM